MKVYIDLYGSFWILISKDVYEEGDGGEYLENINDKRKVLDIFL